ncbi:hypothetical protein VBZ67_04940 [Campylobacter concisus]
MAFYLFLAGLSAGASIVAVLISNKFGKDNYYFKVAALSLQWRSSLDLLFW